MAKITYHQFSKISGIELNTAKTEIMRIGDEQIEEEYTIEDSCGQDVQIKSIEAIYFFPIFSCFLRFTVAGL